MNSSREQDLLADGAVGEVKLARRAGEAATPGGLVKALMDCTEGYRLYMLLVLLTQGGRKRRWPRFARAYQ